MTEIHHEAESKTENEILLGVLDLVERDPVLTQRSVAKELGIALGLANAYLKRCIHKGLVKVSQAPARRYAYYLTPQGFAEKSRLTASYLAYSFSFFRQARAQFTDIFEVAVKRGQRRLALAGEGDLAEIANLVAGKHGIEISGMLVANRGANELAVSAEALGKIDAVVITELVNSREVFEAVSKIFGPDRVYAPELLRIGSLGKSKEDTT